MITRASIRRFLWRHCPSIHEIVYDDTINKEEAEELMKLIEKQNNE